MKGTSVIISHFAPYQNAEKYVGLLRKTIHSVRDERSVFPVEIIVCDDGSYWSRDLNNGEDLTVFGKEEIKQNELLKDLDIDLYLHLPDRNRYRGIILKNKAIELATYSKIVILDDDHPFLTRNAISKFSSYLDKYWYVKGRVIGPTGIPQHYFSKNAQGTTYGFRKELYEKVGGFSGYLYENGYGEDNDILWKFYQYLYPAYGRKSSCFAGDIVTRDLASNRWADRAASAMLLTGEVLDNQINLRHESFVRDFIREHGINPFRKNPARIRHRWMEIPSTASFLSELKYLVIYFFCIPEILWSTLQRIRKKGGIKFVMHRLTGKNSI